METDWRRLADLQTTNMKGTMTYEITEMLADFSYDMANSVKQSNPHRS